MPSVYYEAGITVYPNYDSMVAGEGFLSATNQRTARAAYAADIDEYYSLLDGKFIKLEHRKI